MDVWSGLRRGLLTGTIIVFLIVLGVTGLAGKMVMGWLRLTSQQIGVWILLAVIALWGGATAVRGVKREAWGEALLRGLLAAVVCGLIVALFVSVVSFLILIGADVRTSLVQLTPDAIDLFTFGLAPIVGGVIILAALSVVGFAGAALAHTQAQFAWREALRRGWGEARTAVMDLPAVREVTGFKYTPHIAVGVLLVLLALLPLVLDQYGSFTWGTVGIYVMLGVGLNIVVGLAGLLDLGYVAFFAIGSYTVALLTAPQPHGIMMSFWLAVPIGVVLAAASGVLLGIPVLRMRGDYLAIVTLGFGEIIRILSKSDVLTGFTGGPRGVRAVGGPSLFGLNLNNAFYFLYLIIFGIILVVFLTVRLQSSRVGRAWMAMRDDEDVAQAGGIYTLKYKLLAFAVGAAFAGLSGVIFASRNKFTGPEDFTLLVSINVLCLVIVGGMGSIPGVVMGAAVLKYLPEVLRELDEYRMLAFGTLLVAMMILRPEGIWPSKRRRMELHEPSE